MSFSTPNRLLILFDGLTPEIHQKEKEIRGPKIDAAEKALDGFLRSNNFQKKDLYQKENDKRVFYFAKKPPKIIKIYDLLNENIPLILDKVSWKKSMKWGDFKLYWGRPLKSILAIFNNKNFSNINNLINNLEVVSLILDNDREKARLKIKKMPYSLKKIKFLIALLLPNNFVKRFIEF